MEKLLIATSLLLVVCITPSFALGGTQQDTTPKQDIKDAGSSTKNAAKKTGSATKKETKKVVNKSATRTKEGAQKVQTKTQPN